MKICFQDSKTWKKVVIDTKEYEYIRELKEKLSKTMKLKSDTITFHYNGLILKDSDKVSSYEIEDGDTIVFSGEGQQEKDQTIIIVDLKEEEEEVEINDNEYVRDLKDKLKDRNRVNSENIILHYNGEMLEDNEKISSYGIENNSIIIYNGVFREYSKNNNTPTPTPNEERNMNENKFKEFGKERKFKNEMKSNYNFVSF